MSKILRSDNGEELMEEKDPINPSHYKNETSLECIESMYITFGGFLTAYYCMITAYKYIWRYKNKSGIEDLKKARWFIDKAPELYNDIKDDTTYKCLSGMIYSKLSDEHSRA